MNWYFHYDLGKPIANDLAFRFDNAVLNELYPEMRGEKFTKRVLNRILIEAIEEWLA